MSRHPQWEQRLADLIAENRDRAHEYGKWDCLLFPAEAVKAVTGKDHGKKHRGKYKSFASAYAYLNKLGFESAEGFLDSLFDEKLPSFAQRGDIVLASDGIPAVCMGGFALSIAEDQGGPVGLARVPRSDWVKAWAVGEHHGGKVAHPGRRKKK